MLDQKIFDDKAISWSLNKERPWARMRYEMTNHFIVNYIESNPLKILNVGCGDGIESLLLDSLNGEHVLTDYSEGMLAQAEKLLKERGFRSKVQFIHSDVNNLNSNVHEKFDLILFHNVLEYVEDPKQAIHQVYSLLNDGGILSVRHLNRYTNICVAASHKNDLNLVEEYLHSGAYNSSFDAKIQTYTGEEMEAFLNHFNFESVHRYGIMSLNSFIFDQKIKEEETFYNKHKALEIEMATMFPYFHMARFGLFLCKKPIL